MILIGEQYTTMFNDVLFWLYISGLLTDLVTGNIKAWITKDIDSKMAVNGSVKHFALLGMVLILLPTINAYVGNNTVSNVILLYYFYQYLISIVENLDALGFGFPEQIIDHFRRLKESE